MIDLTPADTARQRAFDEAEHELLIQNSRLGCILIWLFMPLGSLVDSVVFPDLLVPLFVARVLCILAVFPIYPLLNTDWGRRHAWMLSLVGAWIPVLAMCGIISATAGAMSSYYAGINLVMVGVCLLLPYDFVRASCYCFGVILMYSACCAWGPHQAVVPGTILTNLYFILLTATLCMVSCHYATRRRFRDFCLRYELDQRNRELTDLDRLKSQFFANVSHELRTPLTLILAPTERLLQHPELGPAVRDRLKMVLVNSLRLRRRIDELLDLVRLDQRRLHLEQRPIPLREFLSGLLDSVRELARSKQLHLDLARDAEPLTILGDPFQLEKVFLNLLSNAIKFVPPGGTIGLSWERESGVARIQVQDNGPGIPPQDLPHVFNRFYQRDASLTRQHQGLGLGLALARELVTLHGGTLAVQSDWGRGTTFEVRLPLAAEHAANGRGMKSALHLDAPGSPIDEQDSPGRDDCELPVDSDVRWSRAAQRAELSVPDSTLPIGAVGTGPTTILVVDDELGMRQYLVSTLSTEHRVYQAEQGSEALAIMRTHTPDLVILDQMMPGMTGLDICRHCRSQGHFPDLKILMLTARGDEASKLEALEAGADDFLTKPFSSAELTTRIRNLLRAAQLQKDLRQQHRQLKETLEQLAHTESQLFHSEKINALGTLCAGLLHEINNPLNFVMMAVESLGRELAPPSPDACEMLEDIEQGLGRIAQIVSDLRTFAYPERADQYQPFRIRPTLESALRFTAHELRMCQVELPEVDQDLAAYGSPTHICHVLINLLINAAHAVQQVAELRTPRIEIQVTANDDQVLFCVRDNGVGIPPDMIHRIFEPFVTTRDVGQGMGLGLSICHRIVQNHGGQIRVRSTLGQGAEFTFQIPAVRQETYV